MPIATPEQYAAMLDAADPTRRSYGAVKTNVDTDSQFACTRDGGAAEASAAARVTQACAELGSAGRALAAR